MLPRVKYDKCHSYFFHHIHHIIYMTFRWRVTPHNRYPNYVTFGTKYFSFFSFSKWTRMMAVNYFDPKNYWTMNIVWGFSKFLANPQSQKPVRLLSNHGLFQFYCSWLIVCLEVQKVWEPLGGYILESEVFHFEIFLPEGQYWLKVFPKKSVFEG